MLVRPATNRLVNLIFALVCALWAGQASVALGAAPKGLEHLTEATASDPGVVELTDFTARYLAENLRSLRANLDLVGLPEATQVAVTTFQWFDDATGLAIAGKTIEAARRGASVTVVVDGANALRSKGRRQMLYAMAREGVKVLIFHPLSSGIHAGAFRLHEKCVFVRLRDGSVKVIFGGRNKADHYLGDNMTFDSDMLFGFGAEQGEKLYRAQLETIIRSKAAVPLAIPRGYGERQHAAQLERMAQASAEVGLMLGARLPGLVEFPEVKVKWGLFARNRGRWRTVTDLIVAAIRGAKKSVLGANAYFVPEPRVEEAIVGALDSKVDVTVLSNSLESTSHTHVVRAMRGHLLALLERGLGFFARKKGEVHAKTTAVDSRVVLVGSANLDYMSGVHNTENLMALDSPELAGQFDRFVAAQVLSGEYHSVKTDLPDFGPIDRCMSYLVSPFKKLL